MTEELLSAAWKKSRRGAWAFRGFHYQHLLITLLVLRQWAGLDPGGFVVPEGIEDCVIELPEKHLNLQIKSRKEGNFTESEVASILTAVTSKAPVGARCVVALEQPRSGLEEHPIQSLFASDLPDIVVCGDPLEEITDLLSTRLRVADILIEGIVSDIYRMVSGAAAANAGVPFEDRRRFSSTDIERRIEELIAAQDPSAIEEAILSGALKAVDFSTPLPEPGFYLGTKVQPGHVAAGLLIPRPAETAQIVQTLRRGRHAIVCAPSGAGKSALLWLAANELAGEARWFQSGAPVTSDDAQSILRFVRSRKPSGQSPVGLVFDNLAPANVELWNILSQELRSVSGVYLLGSLRQEDADLIADRSETTIIVVDLKAPLAEAIWKKLIAEHNTTWLHWQEPFEQSGGLMLEYVHLLTQGRRLSQVIEDQVRLREREGRQIELSILRLTSAIISKGGEVAVDALLRELGLPPDEIGRAMRRLIDEHLVREDRPGIIGGLHDLRSEALRRALHDEIVHLSMDSLWRGLRATTLDTIPSVVRTICGDGGASAQTVLPKIAEILTLSADIEFWSAVLTGLGLATLEGHALAFTRILEDRSIPKAHWSLAAMFSDPHLDIPSLGDQANWDRLRQAILAFRSTRKADLREALFQLLPADVTVPACTSLSQAQKLLACVAPLGAEVPPIRLSFDAQFPNTGEPDIRDVVDVLANAHHLDPKLAASLTASLGGEDALLAMFHRQTVWTTAPVIETGPHGRTVRSDWFLVAEEFQTDPHETICNICETLIALVPDADAAASDAITAMGKPVQVGAHKHWTKNMPRANIPAKSRVAWNVVFRQIVMSRSVAGTLTYYAGEMAKMVVDTEKIFRSFSETWIKGKQVKDPDALANQINDILQIVNDLAYAAPKPDAPQGDGASEASDTIGALLTGVLGNLMGRMHKITAEGRPRATASFARDLAEQARTHAESAIWRTVPNSPREQLTAMGKRLDNVASILSQFAEDSSPNAVQESIKVGRKADIGKAVQACARIANLTAEARLGQILRDLEAELAKVGHVAKCHLKPSKYTSSWPAKDVAITFTIENFDTYENAAEAALAVAKSHLDNGWFYSVVPVIEGTVIGPAALRPTLELILPEPAFEAEWRDHIPLPFVSKEAAETFEKAFAACVQVSAILMARGVSSLRSDEEDVLSKIVDVFDRQRSVLEVEAKGGNEFKILALDYVDDMWRRIVAEFADHQAGRKIADPLCAVPHAALTGGVDPTATEVGAIRLRILESEARAA